MYFKDLSIFQGISDDLKMSVQYVVELVNDVSRLVRGAIEKFQDSPVAALRDFAKGARQFV